MKENVSVLDKNLTNVEEFRVKVPQEILDDLARRLTTTRLPVSDKPGWKDGTDMSVLEDLIQYWRSTFDWRKQEVALNCFSHFRGELGGAGVHFIHERGRGPSPIPLVLVHGWPDGFFRFTKILSLLSDPAAHGGDPADAFDVVVPSLPGYGFSERGGKYGNMFAFGTMVHALMTGLGYDRFGAHGGDVGSGVCERLARAHADALMGIHLTDVPPFHTLAPPSDLNPDERAYLDRMATFGRVEGGYLHIQGTKPWTLAAALNDSPAGLASWIIEKFQAWSDCGDSLYNSFSRDELLTNIMLYWATETIGTSFLSYRDMMKPETSGPPQSTGLAAAAPIATPTGLALFPKDLATAPRSWADRFFNVRHWTQMASGGHFAALERPEELAADIRSFFKPLRGKR